MHYITILPLQFALVLLSTLWLFHTCSRLRGGQLDDAMTSGYMDDYKARIARANMAGTSSAAFAE